MRMAEIINEGQGQGKNLPKESPQRDKKQPSERWEKNQWRYRTEAKVWKTFQNECPSIVKGNGVGGKVIRFSGLRESSFSIAMEEGQVTRNHVVGEDGDWVQRLELQRMCLTKASASNPLTHKGKEGGLLITLEAFLQCPQSYCFVIWDWQVNAIS